MAKVLLVEDGDIGRLGRSVALRSLSHDVSALAWRDVADGGAGDLRPVLHDVVLAVLSPDTESWDRYPMLPTLASLTEASRPSTTTIALLEGDAVDNPILALRLAAVGVQRVADVSRIRSVADVHGLVEQSSGTVPVKPSDVELLQAGVAPGCNPEAMLAWVAERLVGPLGTQYRNAFEPGYTQAASGLTRRQAHTLRVRLAALGRIRPNPSHCGGGPVRDLSLPRWSEVVGVVNLCRGLEIDRASAGEGIRGQGGVWRAA